ncbi:esterase-like activity of phytase family protein [Pseudooceanicola nitratireducens]|uniref:esterase-like activity of phytase family protein n=1 Tax=Pseudooceanicola nitratireducens TaxID=517719 RepID=UPI001C9661F0|nr:esterase-like activity of phytase family protein [Pseudooceanicola nitratireducens]MBY6167153.1 esterase-like activity of phytase family protein [Pseudooceanicola nitratireducens]
MRLRSAITLSLGAAAIALSAAWAAGLTGSERRFEIEGNGLRIGGLSGLAVLDYGARFLALSDEGFLIEGSFTRDANGLTGAKATRSIPLGGPGGRALDARGKEHDSEGLAISSDGALSVSFEHVHRVAKYREPGIALPYPALMRGLDLPENGGIEALAVDTQDRLYIVQEQSAHGGDVPLMRLEGGRWSVLGKIHPSDGFVPVGADFGPDGMYYLLERKVATLGFRSRIRRFDLSQPAPEVDGIFPAEVIWQSGLSLGNLEGLAIWTDPQGVVHATMVADNNFSAVLYGGMVSLVLAKSVGTM